MVLIVNNYTPLYYLALLKKCFDYFSSEHSHFLRNFCIKVLLQYDIFEGLLCNDYVTSVVVHWVSTYYVFGVCGSFLDA